MASEVYRELCSRMLVPESERLAKIWRILCDEDEARLLLAMPGTAAELATVVGLPEDEAQKRLDALFRKGVAFISKKPQGAVYRMPRHMIQMHDASVQWPEAPQGFYEAWKDFMAIEYPPLLSMMLSAGLPSFMRVVPAMGTISREAGARMDEDLGRMIDGAEDIAIVRCPCRLSEKRCDAPVETCIQFNNGARYNIRRGTGRPITKAEAFSIVTEAEGRGLVHTVENRSGIGNVLCNCCTDCCAILRPYLQGDEFHPILAKSRYTARAEPGECSLDTLCKAVCPVGAITEGEKSVKVDEEKCIGCGLCVHECVSGAMSLHLTRPPDYIPA